LNSFFLSLLQIDWSERCETPGGLAGQVRHGRCKTPRWLTLPLAESEHPASEINHLQDQQRLRKQPFLKAILEYLFQSFQVYQLVHIVLLLDHHDLQGTL
jgi:hypothetical protein